MNKQGYENLKPGDKVLDAPSGTPIVDTVVRWSNGDSLVVFHEEERDEELDAARDAPVQEMAKMIGDANFITAEYLYENGLGPDSTLRDLSDLLHGLRNPNGEK